MPKQKRETKQTRSGGTPTNTNSVYSAPLIQNGYEAPEDAEDEDEDDGEDVAFTLEADETDTGLLLITLYRCRKCNRARRYDIPEDSKPAKPWLLPRYRCSKCDSNMIPEFGPVYDPNEAVGDDETGELCDVRCTGSVTPECFCTKCNGALHGVMFLIKTRG